MKQPSPSILFCAAVVFALGALGFYFGALLPYLKGQAFINAEQHVSSVHTVQEFEQNFDTVFNFYSPVGTEEVTKFLGGNIAGIIQTQDEPVARELVNYIEPHLFPDETRHQLLGGQLYQTLWQRFGHEEDYQKAVAYFEHAHELGPDLPPPLYSLLGLYQAHHDAANTQRIAKIILSKWPQDATVAALVK